MYNYYYPYEAFFSKTKCPLTLAVENDLQNEKAEAWFTLSFTTRRGNPVIKSYYSGHLGPGSSRSWEETIDTTDLTLQSIEVLAKREPRVTSGELRWQTILNKVYPVVPNAVGYKLYIRSNLVELDPVYTC